MEVGMGVGRTLEVDRAQGRDLAERAQLVGVLGQCRSDAFQKFKRNQIEARFSI